ncbi:MAG: nucleotide kinase domain-containing protein [Solirubrobacteraceae bacterium]
MQRREDVYSAYWTFATERQRIFERRLAGQPGPWTDDPILARYRFTNAFRMSDRVTQFLIAEVIYAHPEMPPEDLLVRIMLARLFSKPETWRAIEDGLGPVGRSTLRDRRLPALLGELHATGPIYTSAFILCATPAYGYDRKYLNHLALVRDMVRQRLPRAVASARRLKDVYDALLRFPLIGPFMAYQLAIDINYSELVDFSENEFTMPGPGAERGIRKVFPAAHRREMPTIIDCMVNDQEAACAALGIERPTLFGHPLRAIDCQNLFCELDKYARVRFPELRSNRIRIKAQFSPSPEPIRLFYPPKWGINERLPARLRRVAAA